MNRRSFLYKILGAALGTRLAIECGAKEVTLESERIVNPAWENAEYEVEFFFHQDSLRLRERIDAIQWANDPNPMIFRFDEGEYIRAD